MKCKASNLVIILFIACLTACGPSPWDEPPLHKAAQDGDTDTVKQLLLDGAAVDSLNGEGATPLHWAAFKGRIEVAELLIKQGADVNALTKKGSTPLRLATTHKQTKMIALLKQHGGRI